MWWNDCKFQLHWNMLVSIKLKVAPNEFNYFSRSESYTVAMVEMSKTIPQNVGKPLSTKEKNQN